MGKNPSVTHAQLKAIAGDAIVLVLDGTYYETFGKDAEIVGGVTGLRIARAERDGVTYVMTLFPDDMIAAVIAELNLAGHHVCVFERWDADRKLRN